MRPSMRIAAAVLLLPVLLPALSCDQLSPQLNINVKLIKPCDVPDAWDEVGSFQITSVAADGTMQDTQASRGSNSADISGLTVEDGAQLLVGGYAGDVSSDPSVVSAPPKATGASAPMLLAAVSKLQLPALPSRTYPKSGSLYIPVGKAHAFGSTTAGEDGTCSSMVRGRHAHTATYLPSLGKVLIIGGLDYDDHGEESFVRREEAAELYDPATGKYEVINNIPAASAPLFEVAHHTATALPDGTVLVWGGVGRAGDGTRVEPKAVSFVFDPSSSKATQLTAANGFSVKRFHHQATLVRSGTAVVLSGGCGCIGTLTPSELKAGLCPAAGSTGCTDGQPRAAAVDIFDAVAKTVRTVSGGGLAHPRAFHTATALEGDLVVVAGGDDGISPIAEVEIVRANPPSLLSASESLGTAAVTHAAAVVLSSSDCSFLNSSHPAGSECVLITGGCLGIPTRDACQQVQSTSSLLDFGKPQGSRFSAGPSGVRQRWDHEAFALGTGQNMVLLAGGRFEASTGGQPPVSAEVLPRRQTSAFQAAAGFMKAARRSYASTRLPNGPILFTGGVPSAGTATASLTGGEMYFFEYR